MPVVSSTRHVRATPEVCFDLSQSKELRREWDPFVREQRLIGGDVPAAGVAHWTRSKHGLTMTAEYVTFRRPRVVAMQMLDGPWFFTLFAASWRFEARDDAATDVTFRYRFEVTPWLRAVAEPLGRWLLGRDIDHRLAAFAAGAEGPALVARLPEPPAHDHATG